MGGLRRLFLAFFPELSLSEMGASLGLYLHLEERMVLGEGPFRKWSFGR